MIKIIETINTNLYKFLLILIFLVVGVLLSINHVMAVHSVSGRILKRFSYVFAGLLLFFLISLTPKPVFGATEFIAIIDPDSGDGTGFSSLSAWEDAVEVDLTAVDTAWRHVVITTATAIDANNLDIGRIAGSYFDGKIDDVRLYGYELAEWQVKEIFNSSNVQFGE
jgi:hypothetical protein